MPATPRPRPPLALLGALSALPSLSVDVGLPAMPALARAFGAGPAEAQATLSAFLVGFAAGQLAHGPASDRLGRRPVLLAGLAAFVVAGVVCALTPSLGLLTAMRGVQGVGACAGVVSARAMVRDRFGDEQSARPQSILSLASNLGTLSGPLVGASLLGAAGFRAVYAALPAVGAALLAACILWAPETRPAAANPPPGAPDTRPPTAGPPLRAPAARPTAAGHPLWAPDVRPATAGHSPGAGYRRILSDPRVIAPATLNGLVFGGMFACIAASPELLLKRFGIAPGVLGLLFALFALASLAGSWLNHALLASLPTWTLSSFGLTLNGLATLGLAAAAVAPSFGLFVASMAAQMFACGIIMPNAIAAAMAPLPRLAGTAAAVVGCLQSAFGAAAAALVALAPGSLAGLAAIVAGFSTLGLGIGVVATGDRRDNVTRLPFAEPRRAGHGGRLSAGTWTRPNAGPAPRLGEFGPGWASPVPPFAAEAQVTLARPGAGGGEALGASSDEKTAQAKHWVLTRARHRPDRSTGC